MQSQLWCKVPAIQMDKTHVIIAQYPPNEEIEPKLIHALKQQLLVGLPLRPRGATHCDGNVVTQTRHQHCRINNRRLCTEPPEKICYAQSAVTSGDVPNSNNDDDVTALHTLPKQYLKMHCSPTADPTYISVSMICL